MLKGKVLDGTTGQALEFPNVRVVDPSGKVRQDKSQAMISNTGAFTLPDALPGDLVLASFVGYKPKMVAVGTSEEQNISLEPGIALPEAVVIGEKTLPWKKALLIAAGALTLILAIAIINNQNNV